MEFSTIKLCGVAILCAVAVFLMRQLKRDYEIPLGITGSIILMGAAMLMAVPLVEYIKLNLSGSLLAGKAADSLIRIIGIAMLTRVSSDICKDIGVGNVASSLEWCAKMEIIILTLPLLNEAIDGVKSLLAEVGL